MNSLHNEALTWTGDGSNGSLTQNGNEVSIASASAGTPLNARVDSTKAAEDYYFQAAITKLKGNLSIGVVSKDEFRPGWKVKGMFYNGNLTNGSGALKTSWGPRFQVGDSLGVRVTPGGESLDVAFFKNGESLGTGFRLANSKTVFYPCLHVSGSASLVVEAPQQLPSVEIATAEASGFYGDWKLEKAWDGETPLTMPNKTIKFHLSKVSDDSLQMSFKVGNSMNGKVKLVAETETELIIESARFMMTRMMPPPELRPLESLLGSKKMTKLTLDGSANLVLSGPEMKTEWSRLVRNPAPLHQY